MGTPEAPPPPKSSLHTREGAASTKQTWTASEIVARGVADTTSIAVAAELPARSNGEAEARGGRLYTSDVSFELVRGTSWFSCVAMWTGGWGLEISLSFAR